MLHSVVAVAGCGLRVRVAGAGVFPPFSLHFLRQIHRIRDGIGIDMNLGDTKCGEMAGR
jgi:hypothetical protein